MIEILQAAYRSDPQDWLTHLALADAHEEMGEAEKAYAHRWIATNKPKPILGKDLYEWYLGPNRQSSKRAGYYHDDQWHWYCEGELEPHDTIPAAIWEEMDRLLKVKKLYYRLFDVRSSLYIALDSLISMYKLLVAALASLYTKNLQPLSGK